MTEGTLVACECERQPVALLWTRDAPVETSYKPGPGIPEDIRTGLLEIHHAIRNRRNARASRALCWDVLERVLDQALITWPGSGIGKVKPAPLSAAAEMGATLAASAATAGVLAWIAKSGRDDLTRRVCGDCTTAANLPSTMMMAGLVGLFAGAVGAMIILRLVRDNRAKQPGREKSEFKDPTRIERLEALARHKMITPDLLAWAKQLGLNKPVPPKPGEKVEPPNPPQPTATHEGVSLLGAFVLVLADQLFETPHRLAEARVGRWPS